LSGSSLGQLWRHCPPWCFSAFAMLCCWASVYVCWYFRSGSSRRPGLRKQAFLSFEERLERDLLYLWMKKAGLEMLVGYR
jgi:hypothetical protein